jgi:hypothetical protein
VGKWAAKFNKIYDLSSNGRSKFANKYGTSTSKLYAVVAVPVFFTKIGSMFLVGKDLRVWKTVEKRGFSRPGRSAGNLLQTNRLGQFA